MVRDFGPGLTVDELIGMPAWHIDKLKLPPGEVFKAASLAARIMVEEDLESHVLVELWEDGHSTWDSNHKGNPVVVTPTGLLIRTQ